MAPLEPSIAEAMRAANLGKSFSRAGSDRVKCDDDGKEYFVKTGGNFKQMTGEAESLRAMAKASPGLAPDVYSCIKQGGQPVMISDYFPLSRRLTHEAEKKLGEQLAKMHDPSNPDATSPNGKFGFDVPTHCGPTEQDNTWEESWMVFFRDRRIKDLCDRIGDRQISQLGAQVCERVIPLLLENLEPAPKPVILHGDLWSGNAATNSATKAPVIYDPSSYFGHGEADLGIMHMFGGFGSTFFDAYHKRLPRSKPHYDERIKLYELYHHLNHTLLFGGGYRGGALSIMRSLLAFADSQTGKM